MNKAQRQVIQFRNEIKEVKKQIAAVHAKNPKGEFDRVVAEMLLEELIYVISDHRTPSSKQESDHYLGIYCLVTALQDVLRPRASKKKILADLLIAIKALELIE